MYSTDGQTYILQPCFLAHLSASFTVASQPLLLKRDVLHIAAGRHITDRAQARLAGAGLSWAQDTRRKQRQHALSGVTERKEEPVRLVRETSALSRRQR